MSTRDLPDGRLSPGLVGADDTLPPKIRWKQLADLGAIVGQCRQCQGNLVAEPPDEHDQGGEDGQVSWYETRCLSCGRVSAAPNGRVLARSSRATEQPRGWAERRQQRDAEEVKQRAGYDPDGHPAGRGKRR